MTRLIFSTLLSIIVTALIGQNALDFDGSNDYVQTSFDGVLGSADRTFEAWVKVPSGSSANRCILDYGLNAVGSRNTFSVSGSNALIYISGGTNANISSSGNVVPVNQWTHVAFVLDNGTGYLYVNGVQVGTGSLSTVNTPSGNTDLRIGQRVSGGSIPFLGAIDEVRVWDYARSATEITNDMNAEFCVPDSHLVAYHKFNHGIAGGNNSGISSSYDASGNGNDGTLTNLALSGSTSNWVTGYNLSVGTLTDTIDAVGCDGSYTSPSGNYVWAQSGTYHDTVESIMGCDSILTVFLDLGTSSSSSITASACASYTSPSGLYTWITSGTYMDTVPNAEGCDSVMTINLSINSSASSMSVEACNSYASPSGNYTYTFSGTYLDTVPNAAGCDSIITIDLTIHPSTSGFISESACVSYTSPSGNYTWTQSGTYNDTIPNANGCDSALIINLSVQGVDTGIQVIGTTITCGAQGATFQWLDCDDNYAALSGKTGPSFTPSSTGNYAVAVTQNSCTDTSECANIKIVGIHETDDHHAVQIYPNPASEHLTIELGEATGVVKICLFDILGNELRKETLMYRKPIQWSMDQSQGAYFLKIQGADFTVTESLIIR